MKHLLSLLAAFLVYSVSGWSQYATITNTMENSFPMYGRPSFPHLANSASFNLLKGRETGSFADSAHSSRYDTTNLNFKLVQRSFFTYDSGGMLIQKRVISTDKNGNWKNYSNDTLIYIGSQLRVVISKQWDNQNSVWKNFLKNDYLYDNQNVLTSILLSNWNNSTLSWETSEKLSFEYTSSGLLQQELIQAWNNSLSIWTNNSRTVYSYSGTRLENSRQELWDDISLAWKNYKRNSYNYSNNQNTEILTESFNTSLSAWENDSRVSFTYTTAGKTESETQQTWDGSQWVNANKLIHTYNNDDRTRTLNRKWQAHLNDWRDFSQDDSFFSMHEVFGIGESDGFSVRIQNPVRKGSSIRVYGLPLNRQYTVQLFSLSGTLVHQQEMYSDDLVLIPSQLSTGIYLLNIAGMKQGIRLLVTD